MSDGYAAADDDNTIWAGKKMSLVGKLITFHVSCCNTPGNHTVII
jgi:hypothetical protein